MPKNKGFFDIDESENGVIADTQTENEAQAEGGECVAVKRAITPKTVLVVLSVVVVVASFFVVRWLYGLSEEETERYVPDSWIQMDEGREDREIFLYTPDWDTDISTLAAYQALVNDIIYSPDGANTIAVDKNTYVSVGGNGLKFMAEYVDTIISGDHEKLNSMFTEDYFKDHKKYSAFPQQKLFEIRITKYSYSSPEYQDSTTSDLYYIISYRIYRNDGLFRNDIDDSCELPQLIKVLRYPDGTMKIDDVINLPGYLNRVG